MVERSQVAPDRITVLPRYETVGVRGCHLAGLDFDHAAVPAEALVGSPGQGVELALRSFQITRSALPGMAVGAADTALRTVLAFALGRRLYRRTVLDIPHARAVLGNAFLDLLISDSLALTGARAVHLLPEETSLHASAVKYLVPKLLGEAMHQLSIVLGARFYVREGEFGIFQKFLRDMPVLSLGHAGSAACQATIIPQLPRLARRAWFQDDPAPPELFQPRAELPPIPFERLGLAGVHDSITASLVAGADDLPHGTQTEAALRLLVLQLVGELRELHQRSRELALQDRTALASPDIFTLADRYTVLLAGAAVLGVWRQAQALGGDPFLADPAWAAAALDRLVRRLGPPPAALPPGCAERVHEELLRRFDGGRSFDLYDTPQAT